MSNIWEPFLIDWFPFYCIFSKSSLSHSTSLSVYVDSVISCILFSTKCKSGLAGEKLSGKTHDVGVGGEKQARKTKPEANLANIWKSGLKSYP